MPLRARILKASSKIARSNPSQRSTLPHQRATTPASASDPSQTSAHRKVTSPPVLGHGSSSPLPKAPPKPITNLSQIDRGRRVYTLVGGGLAGIVAVYLTVYGYSVYREFQRSSSLDPASIPSDTSVRYNAIADSFDSTVDFQERVIGIAAKRRDLCKLARGHVLEASCGTGRNSTFWPLADRGPEGVKSITMVDKSREMLDVARYKWPQCGNAWFINALFRIVDLSSPGARVPVPTSARTENGGSGKFDTIVQTMGVCSTGRPVEVLRNLGEMCEEEKGRILLLEHGRSTWGLVNSLLDGLAPGHAQRYGCWFNKDIGEIVRESGLEIVEEQRFHGGTTWWYVLKPRKVEKQEQIAEGSKMDGKPSNNGGWLAWWGS